MDGKVLRWRLLLQALRPLYEADASGQCFSQFQTAKVILTAQPVQIEVVHGWTWMQS